ncbi:Pentatricopeptide repeat-containing protein [Cynara cardunculus var. scolymus]|uniref:Pentatricopeptide repeat-containing protein n=1 Tax=Cynara cardunculus var. scolymus TaxID=59895 RepID=A0A103XFR8_CYNCS|nr:Pentatricopeptide repeat-containing protein [Cynara cardunculus var. scolymus]
MGLGQVLEWRLEKLLKENEKNCDTFSDLIHLCGKIQNAQTAMHVFTSMENHGLKPTSIILEALISAHLSSGNVITALSIFQTMQNSEDHKPTSHTYNLFISAFANLGNSKSMLAWYSAKMASGYSADLETYEALILGSIKLKRFKDADRFYTEMLGAEITPNTSILHGMLVGFCEQKDLDKIRGFLKGILDYRWEINGYMADKLVGFYCELELVEQLEWMLVVLTETNPNQDLDIISQIHNGLIRVYAKLDRLDDVEYSVGRMLKQGVSFSSHKDVEKVLCSYFRKGAYDRLDVFLEFIKNSYKLPRSTYELLVAGYRRARLYEKVDLVIKDLKMVETTC